LFGHGILENLIQADSRLSRTMSVFKDLPGLENLDKKFKDFQGPARTLRIKYKIAQLNPHEKSVCLSKVSRTLGKCKIKMQLNVYVPKS